MSYTRYNASDLSIELIGEKDVARALGNCGKKAPLVIRNAVNETAKDARKVMIREAKKRYAVNGAGRRHLNDLKIRKRAKVSDLGAELHIGGPGQKDAMKMTWAISKQSRQDLTSDRMLRMRLIFSRQRF